MLSMPSPTPDAVIPAAPILVVDDDAKIVRSSGPTSSVTGSWS
jgi:hypothetical protein